ncbi:CHAT domain-containing protein [Streptomyces sp. NBC_00996]|uniref:CHAT domain-containing protein n=1 Tax=Streptomyces sp. NBC_00996 TaxID=2903710 RepID=UPI00386849BB|nr:CHAT domain-containing protein [Streptomyces sp. NBC_00996]
MDEEAELREHLERLAGLHDSLPSGHPDRPAILNELGQSLRRLHLFTHDTTLLNHAVDLHRIAMEQTPPDEGLPYQLNLANALLDRYDACPGDPAALEEALGLLRAAEPIAHTYPGGATAVAASIANAHDRLWDRNGRVDDLTTSITYLRKAATRSVRDAPDRTAWQYGLLADGITQLYTRTADARHLADAAQAAQTGLSHAPPGHPFRGSVLISLCQIREKEYERDGAVARLAEAESYAAEACALESTSQSEDRGTFFNTWANVLRTWFAATHDPALLDKALSAQRTAVEATPPGHMNHPAVLANLATTYRFHLQTTGDTTHLLAAVALFRTAITTAPGPRAAAGFRFGLGVLLTVYRDLLGGAAALDEAERELRQAAAALSAADAERFRCVNALAIALSSRYEDRQDPADHQAAAAVFEEAARTARHHRDAVRARGGLAYVHRLRALQTLQPDDLVTAEAAYRDALALPEIPHVIARTLVKGLADILEVTGDLVVPPTGPLSPDAAAIYREVTELRTTSARAAQNTLDTRIREAHSWGLAAARSGDLVQAATAYRLAFDLLPRLAPQHLNRADRERHLSALEGLGSDAAACALADGDRFAAVEFLEFGRGLLLSESLGLRAEIGLLDTHAPRLGERFLQLRDELSDRPRDSAAGLFGPDTAEESSPLSAHRADAELASYREAAAEMDDVLSRLRQVPGLERFLLPPDVHRLVREVPAPVVVLNAGHHRCDALVVHSGTIETLALPGLTTGTVRAQLKHLQAATRAAAGAGLAPAERDRAEAEVTGVLDWLWQAVTAPVLRTLVRRGLVPAATPPRDPARRPRLWWCPTGPFSGLPLHASGARDAVPDQVLGTASVLDLVVSSYTPTLTALHRARGTVLPASPQVLAVGLRDTPGLTRLAAAAHEVRAVQEWAPGASALSDRDATRAAVLSGIGRHDWFHFAGHAQQDPATDDNGALMCHDHLESGPLTMSDIAESHSQAPSFLAYLSACETGRGRATLTDQALHLAGALQSAGFAHVIASFWPVHSTTSLRVARHFYNDFGTAGATHETTARALDSAVRAARDHRPDRPSWWTPFHHLGP